MTSFFGLFGGTAKARAIAEERAAYLFSPALHFSIDGVVALCHGGGELPPNAALKSSLFLAAATPYANGAVTLENLERLYKRYGKKLRKRIPTPLAFALYDSKKGRLLLGGSMGRKCFLEEREDGILFSSERDLLRSPIAVDLAVFK